MTHAGELEFSYQSIIAPLMAMLVGFYYGYSGQD